MILTLPIIKDHPPPKGPHWDYTGPNFPDGTRLFPDGTWEVKP